MEDAPEALRLLKKYKEPLQHAINEWLFLQVYRNKTKSPYRESEKKLRTGYWYPNMKKPKEKPNPQE